MNSSPFSFLRPALLVVALLGAGRLSASEVNLYSQRHYEVDKEVFADFTAKTGIKVNVVQAAPDQLIERLRSEGANTSADIFMTADAGRLLRAKEAGLLQPVNSSKLAAQVPAGFRDPENHWFAMTARGRVIIYARDRVKPSELSTYEDLADPKWRGRLLVTSSGSAYNQALLASMIAANGPEAAERWARGVAANMARSPQGGDRDQARALAAGLADVAISNTYYIGLLRGSANEADRRAGNAVGLFFPNQDGRGAHINISGAGVTRHAKNRENAVKLLEYLNSPEAQEKFATRNFEFPLNFNLDVSPILKDFGSFKPDFAGLHAFGKFDAEAVRIFERAGWR